MKQKLIFKRTLSFLFTIILSVSILLPVHATKPDPQSALDSVEKWIYETGVLSEYLFNTNDLVISSPIECYAQTTYCRYSTLPYYLGYGLSAVGMTQTDDLLFTVHQHDYPCAVLHLRWKTDHWALEAIDGPDAEILRVIDYLNNFLHDHSLENESIAVTMSRVGKTMEEFDLNYSAAARWYAFTPNRYNGYMADSRLGGIYRTRDALISYYKTMGAEWIPDDYMYTFYIGTEYVFHYSTVWVWCLLIGIPAVLIVGGFWSIRRKQKSK